jgi:hypothetical protein
MNLKSKPLIISIVIFIGVLLIAVFNFGLGNDPDPVSQDPQPNPNEPQLISTTPPELYKKKPLIFKPDQIIELHFNAELENGPETKLVFDPPAEVKIDISSDGKTAKLTPVKPYKLGQGYTLFIKPETKIRGGKTLGKEYGLQFNVINYQGI